MFSISPQVFNTLVCSCPKWLKADFHHISRSGGLVILVDRLNGLGSGLGFTVSVGSGIGIVSNGSWVLHVAGGKWLVRRSGTGSHIRPGWSCEGSLIFPVAWRFMKWGSGRMAKVTWQCHHDQGGFGGRQELCLGGWYMGTNFLRNFILFWWGTGGIGVPRSLCQSGPIWASLVLDLHLVTYLVCYACGSVLTPLLAVVRTLVRVVFPR